MKKFWDVDLDQFSIYKRWGLSPCKLLQTFSIEFCAGTHPKTSLERCRRRSIALKAVKSIVIIDSESVLRNVVTSGLSPGE